MEKKSFKLFGDPIHGQIRMPIECVDIIDHPIYQRSRSLMQTGLMHYVFPGATHTRFSHMLGVCHLAGQWLDVLKKNSKFELSSRENLLIQIAALTHDSNYPFLEV